MATPATQRFLTKYTEFVQEHNLQVYDKNSGEELSYELYINTRLFIHLQLRFMEPSEILNIIREFGHENMLRYHNNEDCSAEALAKTALVTILFDRT